MRKRVWAMVLAVAMVLSLMVVPVSAEETASGTCGDNLTWVLDEDGTLTISGTGDMTNWSSSSNVPWYDYRSSIVTVVIEDGVTSIGNSAFDDYTHLTSVTIPDSVTSIGSSAFYNCTSLTSVTIPDSVTSIGDWSFAYCASLTSVTIPGSVTFIGDSAFYWCTRLSNVTISVGVTSIGDSAFSNCERLTSVTIPDSVTSIGGYAFYNCERLTSVTIPDSVTTIGAAAFWDCTSLTSVTIPDSVTSIGRYAFRDCTSLTSVTIPGSVTSIGDSAFRECMSLTSVTIPDSVTSIGDSTFYWCTSLTSVTIPDSVITIGDSAFYWCTSLTSVTIPDSVITIGDSAFAYCMSLTSVTIPGSVTSIGDSAFYWCMSLTSVTIPVGVTTIADYAFYNCERLTSIIFKGNASSFGDYTFNDVIATAYYPAGNDTWTEDVMQDYGGTITWVAYDPDTPDSCITGHTEGEAVIENVVAATETEDGSYDIVIYCSVCGEELSRETVIVPATGSTDPEPTEPTDPEPTEPTDPEPTEPTDPEPTEPTDPEPTEENPFTDVNTGHYFYSSVLWAVEQGITSGTSETTFSPFLTAERCQVVTFLWRAAGCPEVADGTENPFTDVNEGDYFYTAVLWAVENGITSGTTETKFSPYATCERCQVVTFLYRYAGNPEVTTSENPFTDVDTDDYFYNAVLWAVEQGITTGTSDTTFGPFVTCERCMVVTFLYRALVE